MQLSTSDRPCCIMSLAQLCPRMLCRKQAEHHGRGSDAAQILCMGRNDIARHGLQKMQKMLHSYVAMCHYKLACQI